MIIQKQNVTDYIKCPWLFTQKIASTRPSTIKLKDMNLNIKKHLIEIASYEMKNNCKLDASEYRTRFTNKYYNRPSQLSKLNNIIKDLNTMFGMFTSSAFVGYNVPVEIPILGTSTVYRDVIDFVLTDNDGGITLVEIDSLSDIKKYKLILRQWAHYYAPYSFMAKSFEKTVNVSIIDPETFSKLDVIYAPERFETDYNELASSVTPIGNYYHTNLFACSDCEIKSKCERIGKWKLNH